MEKPAPYSLRSDFDLLEIKVTDDPKQIKAAYDRLLKSQMHKKNYGNSDERAAAEKWLNVCTPLASGKAAGPLVEAILQQAGKSLQQTILAAEGKVLSEPLRASLLETLTTTYNIESSLANRFLAQFLEKNGYKVGKPLRVPIAPARPVEGLSAAPESDGVRLTWTLPDSECDGIVLVRNAERPPRSYTDGDILEKSKARTCLDITAKPGQSYHYTVFSVFKGEPSESGPTCQGYRAPLGVTSLQGQFDPPGVRLTWKPPTGCRRVWMYRTTAPATVSLVGGRPAPPADAITLGQVEAKTAHFVDTSVDPMGGIYYYHAVAEHAEGRFSKAESVSVRVPVPLVAPRARPPRSVPGRISLEWEPAGPGHITYRLTRRGRAAATGSEETIYEGPATAAEDTKLEPGMTYWYTLVAVDGPRQSAPARFAPVVAMGEIQALQITPTSGAVEIKWRAPAGAARLIVRRSEGAPPAGHRDGVEIVGAGKMGVTDRTVVLGRSYSYRICCVFKDPDGHEVVTPGISTVACGPYTLPAAPTAVRAAFHEGTVSIAWEPRPLDVAVFRHAEDVAKQPDAAVPLGDLEGGARRLRAEGGSVQDRFDPAQPWYLLANVVGGSLAVVRHRIRLLDLALRHERQADRIILSWAWPAGLDRVVLTRQTRDEKGNLVPGASASWTVARSGGSLDGDHVDQIDDPSKIQIRSYRIEPGEVADKALQLVVHGTANRCEVNVGRVVWVHYFVRPRRRWLFFRRYELVLRVRDRIEEFPGVRLDLISDSSKAVAPADWRPWLVWPKSPRSLSAAEYVVPIPTPRPRPVNARLELMSQPSDCDVRLRPLGTSAVLRLD